MEVDVNNKTNTALCEYFTTFLFDFSSLFFSGNFETDPNLIFSFVGNWICFYVLTICRRKKCWRFESFEGFNGIYFYFFRNTARGWSAQPAKSSPMPRAYLFSWIGSSFSASQLFATWACDNIGNKPLFSIIGSIEGKWVCELWAWMRIANWTLDALCFEFF